MGGHFLYRQFAEDGTLLYVGITRHINRRTHVHSVSAPWFHLVAKITVEPFDSQEELAAAERDAIGREHPLHNVLHQPWLSGTKNHDAVILGRLGGRVKSEKKAAAARANAKQPRPSRRKPR